MQSLDQFKGSPLIRTSSNNFVTFRLPNFHGIVTSFEQYPRDWNIWYTSAEPENTSLPGNQRNIQETYFYMLTYGWKLVLIAFDCVYQRYFGIRLDNALSFDEPEVRLTTTVML